MNWFYVNSANEQVGPVDEDDAISLISSGRISPDTLVWREGLAEWTAARNIADFQPYFADYGSAQTLVGGMTFVPGQVSSEPQELCVVCGKTFNNSALVSIGGSRVCANCKPAFVQRLQEGGGVAGITSGLNYASFGQRFAARFVDGLCLMVVYIPVMLIFGFGLFFANRSGQVGTGAGFQLLVTVVVVALSIAYETFMVMKFGGNIGKLIVGLRVVGVDGGPVDLTAAVKRAGFMALLPQIPFIGSIIYIIGCLAVLRDDERRAFQDKFADTRVISIR